MKLQGKVYSSLWKVSMTYRRPPFLPYVSSIDLNYQLLAFYSVHQTLCETSHQYMFLHEIKYKWPWLLWTLYHGLSVAKISCPIICISNQIPSIYITVKGSYTLGQSAQFVWFCHLQAAPGAKQNAKPLKVGLKMYLYLYMYFYLYFYLHSFWSKLLRQTP